MGKPSQKTESTELPQTVTTKLRKAWERHVPQRSKPYVDPLPSKTDQSFAHECDVNNIMLKLAKTGELTHRARSAGVYADVSGLKDLQGAFKAVETARTAFETLPSGLRKMIDNDPSKLADFLNDPKNEEFLVQQGVFARKEPDPVPAAPAASST